MALQVLSMKNKAETSGLAMLIIGVTMLIFTFISAYVFLIEDLNIVASSEFVGLFSEALAPLIATVIRIMYLGIMGWIGSILTVRGIQLFTQSRQKAPQEVKPKSSAETELDAVLNDTETTSSEPTKKRSKRKLKGKKGE